MGCRSDLARALRTPAAWSAQARSAKPDLVPPAPGPGPVAVVHLITIGTAFLGALAYALWAAYQPNLPAAVAGLAVAVGLAAYLWNARARLARKLTAADRGRS
jgi:hypothetical protein